MPPRLLRATDSFNSSGATIVPDIERNTTAANNNISTLSSARVLMPQDTLGRELDALQSGDDGFPNWDVVNAAVRSFSQLPAETQSQMSLSQLIQTDHPDFTAYLNTNSQPSQSNGDINIFANLQLDIQPQSYAQPDQPNNDIFRPSSAYSHRSSVSGSEYSYTTTEMDTDEAEKLDFGMTGNDWNMDQSLSGISYPTPGLSAGDPSPPTIPGHLTGPIRGPSEDEEEAKKRRLEHRRQINRKSAQKHRTRQKAELEQLNITIAQKEAKILQLEQELAVERAKTQQFVRIFEMQMEKQKHNAKA